MVTQQDTRAGRRHPGDEREQPLRRRDEGGSRGLRRALPAQLAAGEAGRRAGRRGVSHRRPLRRRDRAHRRAPRGGDPVRHAADAPRRSRALVAVVSHRRRRGPHGVRHRLGPGPATRPWTRSTASSRSTWTRAASRAPGRGSSTTSTREDRADPRIAEHAQWFEDRMPCDPGLPQAGRAGRDRHAPSTW